jgi:putative phage-type endonuclease
MPELIPAEPGTAEWLAARRAGVTATDIVTILGLSTWDSAYSLFWRKLGQVPDVPDNDRFRLGRQLENYVIARWGEEHGMLPQWPAGLYRHSGRTWQLATLDGLLLVSGEPVEVKTWADADRPSWQDGPPGKVRAQVLWQMDVMDVAVGHVGVVFLPSGEFRSYVIEHDHDYGPLPYLMAMPIPPEVCAVCHDLQLMRAAGEEFMARLRLELPPPDPDSSAASLAAVRARFTRQPDKEAEVGEETWHDFEHAKALADHWDARKREVEIKLREQAGEASVLTVDGQPVARRYVMDQQVKAHTRHMDYLKRIAPKDGNDE